MEIYLELDLVQCLWSIVTIVSSFCSPLGKGCPPDLTQSPCARVLLPPPAMAMAAVKALLFALCAGLAAGQTPTCVDTDSTVSAAPATLLNVLPHRPADRLPFFASVLMPRIWAIAVHRGHRRPRDGDEQQHADQADDAAAAGTKRAACASLL